ncbi:MAG: response regulator transcription factor [Dehalococcoidia bacterium]
MAVGSRQVLVVEDDLKTADIVRRYLEKDGYQVATAHDGNDGLRAALNLQPDLIVLDLLLPGLNGTSLCQALRKESRTPIIMLTALSTEEDKLKGLDLGADDYVTKPFSPRELVARVRAVLRRTMDEGSSLRSGSILFGGISVDLKQFTVAVHGQEVYLTPTEFKILSTLIQEPGRVFSRAQLVEKALGYDYAGMDRTVDVHILNLRRKIELDPLHPEYIRTVYGIGYKFGG